AIGAYPVESEDCEMVMVLFVPINDDGRDPNTQSIFEKNEYYSVGEKVITVVSSTHLTIKRDPGSNRCPLKVSLVGVAPDTPKEVNDENAIIDILVSDYTMKSHSQMEIIEEELYVYAIDISYIDVYSVDKKKGSDSSNSQITPVLYKSVRSKLLTVYQNANEESSKVLKVRKSDQDKEPNKLPIDFTIIDSHPSKCVKIENEKDDYADLYCDEDKHVDDHNKDINESDKCEENIVLDDKTMKHSYGKVNKGKGKVTQPVMHNTRNRTEKFKSVNIDEDE
ncbi:9907_t:CDS:2, partial [Racocetra persica]